MLAFLVSDPERLAAFLKVSGIDPSTSSYIFGLRLAAAVPAPGTLPALGGLALLVLRRKRR